MVAGYTPVYTYLENRKKPFPLVVGKTRQITLLHFGDTLLVGAFLPHWRWHKKTKQNILANSGGVALHTSVYTYCIKYKKTLPAVVGTAILENYCPNKFQSKNFFEKMALSNFDNKIMKGVLAIHHQGDIRYGMSRSTQSSCMSLMSGCWTLIKSLSIRTPFI